MHRFSVVGTALAKCRDIFIKRIVIEGLEDFALDKAVEIREIGNHSGGGIDCRRTQGLPKYSCARGHTGLLHFP